jgi:hypothetical protein
MENELRFYFYSSQPIEDQYWDELATQIKYGVTGGTQVSGLKFLQRNSNNALLVTPFNCDNMNVNVEFR